MSARRRKRAARRNYIRRQRADSSAAAVAALEADFERLARYLSTWCQEWDECGWTACRRARACRGPRLTCYERGAEGMAALLFEVPCMLQLYQAAQAADEEDENYA